MPFQFKKLRFILIVLVILTGALASPAPGATVRPAAWAQPLSAKGLTNFYRVSAVLYRGAQPTGDGFLELKKMGIRTVVNLRENHSDTQLIKGTGLTYFHIPVSTTEPREKDFLRFLEIVRNKDLQPVFVHCKHGADRTGTAVALYRITVEGWETEDAIRELKEGGYGYHVIFRDILKLIRTFPRQDRPAP